jgi:hypothetical protein
MKFLAKAAKTNSELEIIKPIYRLLCTIFSFSSDLQYPEKEELWTSPDFYK